MSSYYHPLNRIRLAWKSILRTRGLLLVLDLLTLAGYFFLLRAFTSDPLILAPLFALLVCLYLLLGAAIFWQGEQAGVTKTALYFICRINGLEVENQDPLLQERIDNLFRAFMEKRGTANAEVFNQIKPWELSRPDKRERDRLIWEMRNSGETWENIARKTDTPLMTVRDNYERMLKLMSQKA